VSISSSQVSLVALRQDLDLSANGNMTERAVLNKNIQTSAPVSLADFKGNVLGNQLYVNKAEFGQGGTWPKRRYEGSAHPYIAKAGDVRVSGNKILVSCTEGGAGGGDRGTEYRAIGFCNEPGSHRLTGTSFGRFSSYYNTGEMHIYLIANGNGYLSGLQRVLVRKEGGYINLGGQQSHSFDVQISENLPYITLVLRYIQKDGGRGDTFQHDFWDWKLVRT